MVQILIIIVSFLIIQYIVLPLIDEYRIRREHIENMIDDKKSHLDNLHHFAKLSLKQEQDVYCSLFYAELGVNGKEQKDIINSKEK